jgi:hypothetical protein
MARPLKPTAVHALTGAIAHDPQRFRDRMGEPVDNRALGDPPMYLTAPQRACWGEIERMPLRACCAMPTGWRWK